jgi:hypothetical protein
MSQSFGHKITSVEDCTQCSEIVSKDHVKYFTFGLQTKT